MELYIKEGDSEDDPKVKTPLGLGQAFMNFIVSIGYDNYLLSSDYSTVIAGYAHIYCYDYEMLSGLLKNYGFYNIKQCTIDDSEIDEHRELRTCRYDRDANHSLVVECRKREYIPFSYAKALLHIGSYDVRNVIPQKYSPFWIAFKIIGYSHNAYKYFISKIPIFLKNKLKKLLRNKVS